MSKRAMPYWVFRGSYGHWLCLEPANDPLVGEGKPDLHWFPTTMVACMMETSDE